MSPEGPPSHVFVPSFLCWKGATATDEKPANKQTVHFVMQSLFASSGFLFFYVLLESCPCCLPTILFLLSEFSDAEMTQVIWLAVKSTSF